MDIPGYKIIQSLENEGCGELYMATQLKLGLPVVIKYMPKALLDQDSITRFLDRYLKEGKLAGQLSHSNIAQVHEVGENSEALYSIVDYVPGKSLEKRASGMCLLDKIYVIKQLAGVLDYIAHRKVGHYNIKPSNIILSSETSRSMLTDFGFLRDMYAETELSLERKLIDSTDYASPERQAHEPLDARSDLYSLGAVFCYLLTGKAPFKNISDVAGSEPVVTSFVELPTELAIFQEFIDIALAKMPEERFQSGVEMIEELSKIDDEQILEIEGHVVERKASRKSKEAEAFKGKGNVVPLMSAAKIKQLEFEKLLSPKPAPKEEKPAKDDKELDSSAWADIPETEFVNSYEFINTYESYRTDEEDRTSGDRKITDAAAKIAKPKESVKVKTSKKRVLKTSIKKPRLLGAENTERRAATRRAAEFDNNELVRDISRANSALMHLQQVDKSELARQDEGKKKTQELAEKKVTSKIVTAKQTSISNISTIPTPSDDIEIPQEIYQALAEENWPPYQPAPAETRNYLRRTSLLFLLLLSTVAFYLAYHQNDNLGKLQIPTVNTEYLEQHYERSMDRAASNLAVIQQRARDVISSTLDLELAANEDDVANESILSSATDQAHNPPELLLGQSVGEIPVSAVTDETVAIGKPRKTQKQERIDWLLANAERLKGEGKLLVPADNNALLVYREVLKLNPNNIDANMGVEMLRQEVIEQINALIEMRRLDSADALLTRMNVFFKPAPPVGDLVSRIRALRQSKTSIR